MSTHHAAPEALIRKPLKLAWVVYLRAIAALWVFSYHLWLALGGLAFSFGLPTDFSFGLRSFFRAGYEGVDLFFVLSGFVIAWPYVARRVTALDRYEVVDFYQRRYFRIAPIYYCTLAVAATLIALRLLPGKVSAWSLAAHVAFAENFYPAWVASILGTYWTLPTEIHFYILFPLLLRFVDIRRPLRMAACLVLFAVAYRFLAFLLTTRYGISAVWTTGYLPGRIDQFGCGIAAACLVATSRPRGIRTTTVTLSAVFAVGCAVLVARHVDEQFGLWYFAGPSLVGAAIALFVCNMGAWARDRQHAKQSTPTTPTRSAIYLLGEASLSVYLWHLIFIELALVAALHWQLGAAAKLLLLLAAVPITLVVSILTYRFIEAPIVARSKSPAWRLRLTRFIPRADAIGPRQAADL